MYFNSQPLQRKKKQKNSNNMESLTFDGPITGRAYKGGGGGGIGYRQARFAFFLFAKTFKLDGYFFLRFCDSFD